MSFPTNADIERAIDEIEPEEDNHSNRSFYLAVGVVVLLFAGFLGYQQYAVPTGALTFDELHQLNLNGKLDEEKGYVYNGFSFVLFDKLWYTDIDKSGVNYRIPLHYGPRDVLDIPVFGNVSREFNVGTDVYVTVNPLSSDQDFIALSASELAQNLAVAIQRRPIGACDRNETSMCGERPIVTCETTDKAMIYLLTEEGKPSVQLKGKCIIVRGVGYDLVKAVDRLILQWYGIM